MHSKSKSWFNLPVAVLAIIAVLVATGQISAQEKVGGAGVLFLNISHSARANGMGQCVVNMVNEESVLYNPGSLGLLHLQKIFAITAPAKTKWLPELTDDFNTTTFNASGGVSRHWLSHGANSDLNYAASVAYSRTKLDYGKIYVGAYEGTENLSIEAYDKADMYSAAVGVEYYFRIGIGYTYKKIVSHLTSFSGGHGSSLGGKATAHDIGAILELPIGKILTDKWNGGNSERTFGFELTPSVAYAKLNTGDPFTYPQAAQSDRLPKISRVGLSIYSSLKVREATAISVQFASETEKELYGSDVSVKKWGLEIGLLGIGYVRTGKYNLDNGRMNFDTDGFGLSLNGAILWLENVNLLKLGDGFTGRTVRSFDLSYDYAKYPLLDNMALSGTKFARLRLSF